MNSHIIDNSKKDFFDLTLESFPQKNETGLSNLGSLLFNKLPHRQEDSDIIISHIKEELVRLSLMELRNITANLYGKFYHHGIQKGNNVLLTSLESNSEIYIAILFLALSSYGVNVFLPMYVEKDLIADWHRKVKFDFLCLPGEEIYALEHHERQKRGIDLLQEFAVEENITCLDLFKDFQLNTITNTPPIENTQLEKFLIDSTLSAISGDEIALSITTSGTSGVSKIIAYDHKSFLINLSAWEKAGLFNKNKLGGRGFTPLFTHTMGIRSFFNALWLGSPMILINTDWFIKKPEAVCYFLSQSKPEHITGGPAVFNMILEMCRAFPELKRELRTSLKTIISSGTAINTDVIDKMRDVLNELNVKQLFLLNVYKYNHFFW